MTAYYNENDPDAVAALHELIADDVIAPGHVDSRSIKDVTADDLKGYTQAHFFAGGGLWSVAARLAGWPDSRALWTASCPCQPWSVAGGKAGADDPRHLWPDLFRILSAARRAGNGPPVLMGEQVSGKAGYAWFDGVRTDLASENYAGRTRDIPACSVDAPHERNRLYWVAVADAESERGGGEQPERGPIRRAADRLADANGNLADRESGGSRAGLRETGAERYGAVASDSDGNGDLAHPNIALVQRQPPARQFPVIEQDAGVDAGHADGNWPVEHAASERRREGGAAPAVLGRRDSIASADVRGMVNANSERREELGGTIPVRPQQPRAQRSIGRNGSWWADAEWIVCHDGKARRAKPGIPMLVDGLPGRVGLWRLAGNAISPILAAEVIGAFLDAEAERLTG